MADADLLTLTQWLSPAFPVGSYAYSHGLESVISSGEVASAEDLERWLSDVLRFGSARVDAILLVQAKTGTRPLAELTAMAEALAGSRERHQETMEQGAAFVRAVNAVSGSELPAMAFPVAVGAASASLDLSATQVAALYLHAMMSNLVSVGVRFIPLGQSDGQSVLSRLHGHVTDVAEAATDADISDIGTAVFGADVSAIVHENLDVRLFKT